MSDTRDRTTRSARLNLRASEQQVRTIRTAAAASGASVSDFVLSSAVRAAEQELADRRWFLLEDAAWSAFEVALEQPAHDLPRLRQLLVEQDFFAE